MRKAGVVVVAVAACGLWLGCSSSNGPGPTFAGRWQVSIGALDSGTVFPPLFDVVVRTSGDSFVATVPSIAWSVGPTTFDSGGAVEVMDSNVTFIEYKSGSAHPCDYVLVAGIANAARDTIHSAIFVVGDTDNAGIYLCKPKASASATVTK